MKDPKKPDEIDDLRAVAIRPVTAQQRKERGLIEFLIYLSDIRPLLDLAAIAKELRVPGEGWRELGWALDTAKQGHGLSVTVWEDLHLQDRLLGLARRLGHESGFVEARTEALQVACSYSSEVLNREPALIKHLQRSAAEELGRELLEKGWLTFQETDGPTKPEPFAYHWDRKRFFVASLTFLVPSAVSESFQ